MRNVIWYTNTHWRETERTEKKKQHTIEKFEMISIANETGENFHEMTFKKLHCWNFPFSSISLTEWLKIVLEGFIFEKKRKCHTV